MKFRIFSTLAIATAAALCLLVSCENNDYGYRIKDGAVVYNTPGGIIFSEYLDEHKLSECFEILIKIFLLSSEESILFSNFISILLKGILVCLYSSKSECFIDKLLRLE